MLGLQLLAYSLKFLILWFVSHQRLVDEFETQSNTLKEMSEQVGAYEKAGKLEAASRLRDQMQLLEVSFLLIRLLEFLRSFSL